MQIAELAAKLESLGLSEKEAKVYVTSLFLGPAPAQKIAQQAGVNRATTYVILDQLQGMGLVTQTTEGKKTVFIPEPPEALNRWFDHMESNLNERRNELKALLPELKVSQRSDVAEAPVVRFYKGKEGIAAINAEQRRKAKPGTEIYGFTNYTEVERIFPEIFKANPKARLKKKLSSKVIYSYNGKSLAGNSKQLRQTKKVDFPIKADISLFSDTAALSTYGGKESISVAIESKEIVEALRQLFELAWNNKR
jgi:HTH-type transcriptional regulator, sugar sensing transcriptional regulator